MGWLKLSEKTPSLQATGKTLVFASTTVSIVIGLITIPLVILAVSLPSIRILSKSKLQAINSGIVLILSEDDSESLDNAIQQITKSLVETNIRMDTISALQKVRNKDEARAILRAEANSISTVEHSVTSQIITVSTILIISAMCAMILPSLRIWSLSKNYSAVTFGVDAILSAIERAVVKSNTSTSGITGSWEELQNVVNHANLIIDELSYNREISDATQNEADLESALHTLQPKLAQKLPCERLAVAFVDQFDGVVAEFAISSSPKVFLQTGYYQQLSKTSLVTVAAEKKPRIIHDLIEYYAKRPSEATKLILDEGFLSSLTIPLASGTKCVGFLFLNARERDAYQGSHIPMVERIISALTGPIFHHYIVQLILSESARGFIKAMGKKDNETSEHLSRMSRYSHLIARKLAKDSQYAPVLKSRVVREILWYSPLLDIGKIGIPENILFKPGPLNLEEWEIMKTHVTPGGDIIRSLNDGLTRYLPKSPFSTALEIVCGHHEKWDGTGYPHRLAGNAIPVTARIAAAADILDALTTDRPYKKAWSLDEAFSHLASISGSHLDPLVYKAALECQPDFEKIYTEYI